jgi:dCTP diphosphatase
MTSIKEFQNHINEFDKKREWDGFYPYDILLNINEEVGEVWHRMAWVDDEKKKMLIEKYKDKFENDIADIIYLALKLANQFGVDAEKGLLDVFKEYEKRFPIQETKGKTANKDFGIDKKDE